MIPASFASMILKFVLPEVREILVPLFKYKDEPNDADIRIDKLEVQMEMLAKDTHPEKPFEDRITALEKKIAK